MDGTTYTTVVRNESVYHGSSLEHAVRAWDGATFNAGATIPGGIAVAAWANGVQVRDGWILHVREDGTVYLNPRVKE